MAEVNDSAKSAICSVDGCKAHANRVGAQLCEAHYIRKRRKGTTDLVKRPAETRQSAGYVLQVANGHPLARGKFRAYQHRIVYYDHHGVGPFDCHWCKTCVTWDDLHIDHLDDTHDNNDINNLVASCARCNQARGAHKVVAWWRDKCGIEVNGVTKTPNEWARHHNISRTGIQWRIKHGWSKIDAVTTPRGKFGPRRRSDTPPG